MKPISSKRNENGMIQAGSHLVIIDDSSCDQTNAEQLSDPKILNYYRQFLIEGFDDWYLIRGLRIWSLSYGPYDTHMSHIIWSAFKVSKGHPSKLIAILTLKMLKSNVGFLMQYQECTVVSVQSFILKL